VLNGLLVQEPQIERPEHEDNSDVHYQPLPKPVPEEQDVHADHDDYQCEHVKHNGYLISHPSFLLRAAEYRPPFLSSLEKRGPTLKIRTIFSGGIEFIARGEFWPPGVGIEPHALQVAAVLPPRHRCAGPAIMRGWIAWTPYDF